MQEHNNTQLISVDVAGETKLLQFKDDSRIPVEIAASQKAAYQEICEKVNERITQGLPPVDGEVAEAVLRYEGYAPELASYELYATGEFPQVGDSIYAGDSIRTEDFVTVVRSVNGRHLTTAGWPEQSFPVEYCRMVERGPSAKTTPASEGGRLSSNPDKAKFVDAIDATPATYELPADAPAEDPMAYTEGLDTTEAIDKIEGEIAVKDEDVHLKDLDPQFRRFYDLYAYTQRPSSTIPTADVPADTVPIYQVEIHEIDYAIVEEAGESINPEWIAWIEKHGDDVEQIVDVRATFENHLNFYARSGNRRQAKSGEPHACDTVAKPKKGDYRIHRHKGWFWKPGGKQQFNAAMRAWEKQKARQDAQNVVIAKALDVKVSELDADAPQATCHPERGRQSRGVNHEGKRQILQQKRRHVRKANRALWKTVLRYGSLPIEQANAIVYGQPATTIEVPLAQTEDVAA